MVERSIQEVPEFSVLIRNALLAMGIRDVNDLALLNAGDLIRIPRIGKKGKSIIIKFCLDNKITLNESSYFRTRQLY